MQISDFIYDFPAALTATRPVEPRDHARLLLLEGPAASPRHHRFFELGRFLRPGDCLVINQTKVRRAKITARKPAGGRIELLLLAPYPAPSKLLRGPAIPQWGPPIHPAVPLSACAAAQGGSSVWLALTDKGKPGLRLSCPGGVCATLLGKTARGEWICEFSHPDLVAYMERHGEMPLPPYIVKARNRTGGNAPAEADEKSYQTVYARADGSIAAPTAGLHFTPELLDNLKNMGVAVAEIVLHVGWGTFRPVFCETVEAHTMLEEYYRISPGAAREINRTRDSGGRVVAVGTTSVRTLESAAASSGKARLPDSGGEGWTNLFIYPGHLFKMTDALLTNFHQPKSTPLLLTSAFFRWRHGRDGLMDAYRCAIDNRYRLYSYGDAMLIL
ncbi:MAG: tRNA preQ1(34) S-adenosylmethionine ribosyltransferase-isomerase QueA [Elusimicrobia bacterium]|nr:tRNA preQ1(34) S-adenosylmethionine ribosyltransferase-isomerase QueA [Elusimicrobiota bacterium]